MHFVIPIVVLVTVVVVCERDLSDAGYYPAQPYERQHFNSPPPEERRYQGIERNRGVYEGRPVDFSNNGHIANNDFNREQESNERNGRRHYFPHMGERHHGVVKDGNMDVNLAFERQSPKRQRDSNLNLPTQSFNINSEYAERDDASNNENSRSFNQNLPAPREEGDMVFRNNDDHDKNAAVNPNTFSNPNNNVPKEYNTNNNRNNDVPKTDIISFLGKVNINVTNENVNSNTQTKIQHEGNNNDYNQNGFKSDIASNTDQRPSKTTIENEVTPNPFLRNPIAKENKTVEEDKWIWGDGGETEIVKTTTDPTITLATLDDRAAFDGDKCATGMARIGGKCVPTD